MNFCEAIPIIIRLPKIIVTKIRMQLAPLKSVFGIAMRVQKTDPVVS
jgi:hypothetical protein